MFIKYPIQITIVKKYQNGLSFVKDQGRYFQKKQKSQNGTITRTAFKIKKAKAIIPAPAQEFYQDIDGKRHLNLLQISREEYLPLEYSEGKLTGTVKIPVRYLS